MGIYTDKTFQSLLLSHGPKIKSKAAAGCELSKELDFLAARVAKIPADQDAKVKAEFTLRAWLQQYNNVL